MTTSGFYVSTSSVLHFYATHFGVIVRYNALSRVFESAFRKEGVPTRILGGQRFFERVEARRITKIFGKSLTSCIRQVKDLLAYLQVLDNPSYLPAFTRVINVPSRGLGQKVVSAGTLVTRMLTFSLS